MHIPLVHLPHISVVVICRTYTHVNDVLFDVAFCCFRREHSCHVGIFVHELRIKTCNHVCVLQRLIDFRCAPELVVLLFCVLHVV